jgi:hypothetical protein
MIRLTFTPTSLILTVILYATLAGALALGAYHAGRNAVQAPCCDRQHTNDLIRVGFTVIDPEGYVVRDFDE